ncbi:hypothetical protein [Ensifer sp. Root423]|uniref:hypothetical protein n=1 Tax=Ensifer sp. Root423 TaxID=1736534 RepID=UPI0012E969F3|nr:hypothetical protein [Ensifer sp. Root423]
MDGYIESTGHIAVDRTGIGMVRPRKIGFSPAFLLHDAFLGPLSAVICHFKAKPPFLVEKLLSIKNEPGGHVRRARYHIQRPHQARS